MDKANSSSTRPGFGVGALYRLASAENKDTLLRADFDPKSNRYVVYLNPSARSAPSMPDQARHAEAARRVIIDALPAAMDPQEDRTRKE